MVKITISELYPSKMEKFLDELTAREMNMIEGGRSYTEDNYNSPTQEDVSNIIKKINDEIEKMKVTINGTTYNLGDFWNY